jgi:hypothetical protein
MKDLYNRNDFIGGIQYNKEEYTRMLYMTDCERGNGAASLYCIL